VLYNEVCFKAGTCANMKNRALEILPVTTTLREHVKFSEKLRCLVCLHGQLFQ